MDLSIIIPAYNEAAKINRDIEAAAQFLKEQGFSGEIIVVDDGSSDKTSEAAHRTDIDSGIKKTVITFTKNQGKGAAVREGIKASSGDYVMFADSGLCVPYANALIGIDLIKTKQCSVANGSRRHAKSQIKRQKSSLRLFLSAMFRYVAYSFIGIPKNFTDTQCGFKVYDGQVARELYTQCLSDGFLFDLEIICRALQKGYNVCEFPVEWKSDPDTRVLPHLAALPVAKEFIRIKHLMSQQHKNVKSQKWLSSETYSNTPNDNVNYKNILDPGRRYQMLFLGATLLVLIVRLATIGLYPLMDTTEARYAEIAREMVTTNNWITPQLNPGEPFWGKPPLSFWLTALSFKAFGINEFTARLPSVILGIFTLYLTYVFGRKFRDKTFGFLCALILSTTGLFFVNMGSVMTDPSLAAAIALSMGSFYFTLTAQTSNRKKQWGYLFFVGLALSLLAKGPVGIVLIGIPIFLWCLLHNKWKVLWQSFPWISGLCLTFLIAAPWYFLAESKTPGFWEYFFVGEHFKRFTVSGWQGDLYGNAHAQPKGMIWIFAIPATMPWTVIFVAILFWLFKRKRVTRPVLTEEPLSYVILWFLSPLILFAPASNILIPYIAPSLPAFAVMMATALYSFRPQASTESVPWFFSPKAIIPTAAFVPAGVLFFTLTFLPKVGEENSQIKMVKIYEALRTNDRESLIYLQKAPQSAEFYSKGAVQTVLGSSRAQILEKINDRNRDFFVSENNYNYQVPSEVFARTEIVGQNKEYTLYREKP